jgi:hypothetical protein
MDEARTLVLGTQVLLGFQYQSVFEPRFPQLTDFEQAFSMLSLGLLLVAFCLLILPAANHIIANHGEDDGEEYRLTNCVGLALAPFALALGFAVYLAAVHVVGQLGSILCGVLMAGLAASFWYGVTFRGQCMNCPSLQVISGRLRPASMYSVFAWTLLRLGPRWEAARPVSHYVIGSRGPCPLSDLQSAVQSLVHLITRRFCARPCRSYAPSNTA